MIWKTQASKRMMLGIMAALLFCLPVLARELPPNIPSPEAVSFHMPVVDELPNGLRIVLVERHNVPIVRLYAIVQVGAEADPAGLPGTATMVAGLLPEGTHHRNAYQIAQAVDQAGGSIDTGAGWDQSYVNVSVLSNHKARAFDLLADMLVHPAFASDEVERIREQTLSALDVVDQDPSYVANMVVRRLLFAGTDYAHSEDGTRSSIEHITRKDLVDFHARYYAPSRTILAVVGDITQPQCLRLASRFLGGWNNGRAVPRLPRSQPPAPRGRQVIVVNKPDSVQTVIRVANIGVPRSSPDYFALSIANQVLGGPAANRLFDILRTRHGLVYGASSDLDCYSSLGAWVAKTSTRSAETIKATEMVLGQMERMRGAPIQQWELQNARDYLVGNEALKFESASQVANQVLEMMLYHLPRDYWNLFPKRVRSVTADEVLSVTRKYLNPDDDVIVLVGNLAAFKDGLKRLGHVRVVPIADIGQAFPEPKKGTADRPSPAR